MDLLRIAAKVASMTSSELNKFRQKYESDVSKLRYMIKSTTPNPNVNERPASYDRIKKAIESSLAGTKAAFTDLAYSEDSGLDLDNMSNERSLFEDLYEPLYQDAMKATGTNNSMLRKFYKE